MKISNSPFCSIVILNYYGEKIIGNTLNSLLSLDYPKSKYEIIVVDNGSKDGSRELLELYVNKNKNIRTIYLDKNLGFSKGNNIGIKNAKGKYIALLNNDCIVEQKWLKELVNSAENDKKVFAVNSKILRYPKYVNIIFRMDPRLTPVYTWLSKSSLYGLLNTEIVYLPLWKRSGYFEIELPYDPYNNQEVEFTVLSNPKGLKINKGVDHKELITFKHPSIKVVGVKKDNDDIEYKMSVKTTTVKDSRDKVQNAGIMVFQDGYGRDVGAVVRAGHQFYEYDLKQYDIEREIYAACGAAVLYKKKVLDKIGYLDEAFFMYYEDVEICERARFFGYKSLYNPKAVVRHIHAASSKEWSPFFIYHVEKGRLLHVFYNYPMQVFFFEYFKIVIQSVLSLISVMFRLRAFFYNVKTKNEESGEGKFIRRIQTIKALTYLLINFPLLLIRRIRKNRWRNSKAVDQNYQRILKGEWYFS